MARIIGVDRLYAGGFFLFGARPPRHFTLIDAQRVASDDGGPGA